MIWKRVVISLLAVILTLVVLELGFRISGYDLNRSPNWRHSTEYGWTIDPQAENMDNIHPDGFRYTPVNSEKPTDTKRIIILGDSFVQAAGVPYAKSFPGLLEHWLNAGEERMRWEIINLAVGDWGTAQEWIALREYGMAYSPDVVIVQTFPMNDMANNAIGLVNTGSLQDHHRPYFVIADEALRPACLNPWRTSLRNVSLLFGFCENVFIPHVKLLPDQDPEDRAGIMKQKGDFFLENARMKGLEYPGWVYSLMPEPHQPAPVREGWRVTEGILGAMAEMLDGRGVPCIALVVPYFKTFEPFWGRNKSLLGAPDSVPDYGTERMEIIFHDLGMPLISLRTRINEGDLEPGELFHFDGHFSPLGHFYTACWILEIFEREGILEQGALPPEVPSINLMSRDQPEGVWITGLSEITGEEGKGRRFGLGPQTVLIFSVPGEGERELAFRMTPLMHGQGITIAVNDSPEESCLKLDRDAEMEAALTIPVRHGRNEIRIMYDDWNRKNEVYFPEDKRPLAVVFLDLTIR
jgi:hypothetical protein